MLGTGFIALALLSVWATYGFFTKAFVDTAEVTLLSSKAGTNLPSNADVKLRGMIVGEVSSIDLDGDKVAIKLGLQPDKLNDIPEGVTAQIVPKTLFGEKYIQLIAPEAVGSGRLQAGDTITRTVVPLDIEQVLNDLYPLLTAVDPAELSYTLSAISQALDGRGKQLGQTLVQANDYLKELNPEIRQLVTDLVKTGDVAQGYGEQMPTIGRFLDNAVFTGNTIVAKRTQLAAFFDEGTALADSLTAFTKANGDTLVTLADQSATILNVGARYATTFPCFLGAVESVLPRLSSVFRNETVHIDLKTLRQQPTGYESSENAEVPSQSQIDGVRAAEPNDRSRRDARPSSFENAQPGDTVVSVPVGLGAVCDDLEQYAAGKDPLNGFIYPGPSEEVYKLVGIDSSHNGKFGDDAAYQRAAAANTDQQSVRQLALGDVDTAEQREFFRQVAANQAGVDADAVPDAAAIMVSTLMRGTEVSVR